MSELTTLIQTLKDSNVEKADKVIAINSICKQYPWIKEVFLMTYDPYYQYYVKTKFPKLIDNKNDNIQDFDKDYWDSFMKDFLLKLNKREYDTKTYISIIENQLQKLNNEDQEIFRNIIYKDLRIGFAAKSINNALNEELIPVSTCQLCKTYSIDMNIKNVDGFWASRKLNGLRGQFKYRNNKYVFLTREELPLIGFDEIEKELNQLQVQYDLSLIDGEIFNINLPFQSIISVARGEKQFDPEQKKLLKFNIFNIQKNNHKWKNTQEMIEFITNIFNNSSFNYIIPLQYEYVKNNSIDIVNKCKQYTNEGYEGIVLRDPIISYEPGKRNNHLLKYKLFSECDLVVKDILFGAKGKKWENSIAALLCEGIVRCRKVKVGNDILYQPISLDEKIKDSEYIDINVRVEAACSSCTDKEREELTNTPKENIIGKIVEVKFQSITDKPNEEGIYSLQFPVFEKFKDIK